MLHLLRKEIILSLAIVCFLFSPGQSQSFKNNQNYFDFHKKDYYFGISLGLNSSRFNLIHSGQFIGNDSINVAEGANGPGFNVHIIGNLKIGDYFDFRVLPGFSFVERELEYQTPLSETGLTRRRIESVFFEVPLHVRYKSAPYKDKRVFVIGGIKYSYDVANNSKTRQADSLVKISPHDFQLEVGAGIQFFFPYFIFSPEIKFSSGIGNILIYNNQLNEASVLEKILSRVLTISFHFEG